MCNDVHKPANLNVSHAEKLNEGTIPVIPDDQSYYNRALQVFLKVMCGETHNPNNSKESTFSPTTCQVNKKGQSRVKAAKGPETRGASHTCDGLCDAPWQ